MEIRSLKTWFGLGATCVGNAMLNILPDSFNWLGWPLLAIGLGLLAVAFFELIFNRLKLKIKTSLPFQILMPLDEVALSAYEFLRKKEGAYYLELLDGSLNGGEDERLRHLVFPLIKDQELWGRHLPSRDYETVPEDAKHLLSLDCQSIARNISRKETMYSDLYISRSTAKRFLKGLKK